MRDCSRVILGAFWYARVSLLTPTAQVKPGIAHPDLSIAVERPVLRHSLPYPHVITRHASNPMARFEAPGECEHWHANDGAPAAGENANDTQALVKQVQTFDLDFLQAILLVKTHRKEKQTETES